MKVVNWEKDKDKPLKISYEAVAGAIAWIFKNHNKEQLATKVEFEGNIRNPKYSYLGTNRSGFKKCVYSGPVSLFGKFSEY